VILAEGTTATTDAALAVMSWAGLAWLRRHTPPSLLRASWLVVLGTFGIAALLGSIAHGFPWSDARLDLFWQPLYLSLGVAVAYFVIASICAAWGDAAARKVRPALLATAGVFYLLTRMYDGEFLIFVIYQGAGLLFALGAHAWLARNGRAGAGWIAAGLAVSLAAGAVQAVDIISLRIVWTFDHNGVYHLIQGVGLGLLLFGLRPMLGGTDPARLP
jgi:hypothetical protein